MCLLAAVGGYRPGRPGRRLCAEHPRDARRLPRRGIDRRRVVELRAGVRCAGGDRPLPADRTESAAHRRRLPLRRPAHRSWRPRRAGDRCPADARTGTRRALLRRGRRRVTCGDRRDTDRVGRRVARRTRRAARVRRPARRSSAVCAVLVGHHRTAEGHRPRPRGHRRRAPQDVAPPSRPHRRRPVLLVHHHGLDDVEPARLRPARRHNDRAVRRRPRRTRPVDALVAGRRHEHHRVRRVGPVPDGLPQGRAAARRRPDPLGRVDRGTAARRRVSLGPRDARRAGRVDRRRHRRVLGIRRAELARPGARRARFPPACSAAPSRRSTRRAVPVRPASPASWSSLHRCRRCPSPCGATPTAAGCGRRTSRTIPACGATATG